MKENIDNNLKKLIKEISFTDKIEICVYFGFINNESKLLGFLKYYSLSIMLFSPIDNIAVLNCNVYNLYDIANLEQVSLITLNESVHSDYY